MTMKKALPLILGLALIPALTVRPVRAEDDLQKAQDAKEKKEHFEAQAQRDKIKAHHMRKKAAALEHPGTMDAAADADKAAAKEDKNAKAEMKDAADAAATERKDLNNAAANATH